MFELLGTDDDETRMLVNRAIGYSIAIPGRPRLAEAPRGSVPTYDVIVKMEDQPMELGFRVDTLPAGMDPAALAHALALAYAKNRASEPPNLRPLQGPRLARGATAGATALYTLRDAASRTMEQLEVTIRAHAGGLWALYVTVRYPVPGINPLQWGHFRGAIRDDQRWDGSEVPQAAPALFPPSPFAHPNVTLAFTDAAWDEARAKAGALPPLTDADATALIRTLIELAGDEAPPSMDIPPVFEHLVPSRIRGLVPETISEPLVRNFEDVKTMHDYRAWAWQCIWAIGNCGSVPDQN